MRAARRLPSARQLQLDGVLLAGGLRALLLQLAHPAVGHGVAVHSDFARDPLHRLSGTLAFVYVVAAGDPDLVAVTARRVGDAHRPVVSGEGAPVAFDARDPRLQFWVAATIHDTALRIAEAVWGPLPARLADELLAMNGRIATVLGLPRAEWPADRESFDTAFAAAAAELRWDAVTLRVARTLRRARNTPPWARLGMPLLTALTLPTLPAAARAPELGRSAPGPLRTLRRIAPVWRLLPGSVRRMPARRILARITAEASSRSGAGAVGGGS